LNVARPDKVRPGWPFDGVERSFYVRLSTNEHDLIRHLVLFGLLTAVSACTVGTDGPPSTTLPPLAGRYPVAAMISQSNAFGTPPYPDRDGVVTLGSASVSGWFMGSYVIEGASGILFGREDANGVLTLRNFGAWSAPPLENEALLERLYPQCLWDSAADGQRMGEISTHAPAPPGLELFGSVEVQCPSPANSAELIPNQFSFTASGFRDGN
jgi:hypothetical protein